MGIIQIGIFLDFFKDQLKINEDVDSKCNPLYILYYKLIKCVVDN